MPLVAGDPSGDQQHEREPGSNEEDSNYSGSTHTEEGANDDALLSSSNQDEHRVFPNQTLGIIERDDNLKKEW